jgi:16S rRNA pseudouridine516 synthase
MLIRLDKYLADMQVGTRSEVKELIRKKRVTVNDNIVTKPESNLLYPDESNNPAPIGIKIGLYQFSNPALV